MVKVLVIGLDGGSWNVINPLLKKEELPTFREIIKNGFSGNLQSTIPPATFPGWKCYSTGKNPGKLSVFGFLNVDVKNKKISVNSSSSFKSKEIWDYLTYMGFKSGVVNMPTTYPPKYINGFMISHSLIDETNFTYPKTLEEELNEKFEYRINPKVLAKVDKDSAIEECYRINKIKFEASKYLIKKYNPDFFHITIFETDHLQHYFWKDMNVGGEYKNVIPDFYKFIDSEIDELIKTAKKDELYIFIMSDHGFVQTKAEFSIGQFFINKNYVKLNTKSKFISIFGKLGYNRENIVGLLKKLKLTQIVTDIIPRRILIKIYSLTPDKEGIIDKEGLRVDKIIDWNESKIIFGERERYYINTCSYKYGSEEYYNFRDKVINEMLEIKDPETGDKLYKSVFTKESVYSGPYLDVAPDIVVLLNDGYIDSANYGGRKLWEYSLRNWNGTHSYNGILIGSGPGIKKDHKIDAKIYDLAPTILHIFGLPIPNDMDGKVLTEIFKQDSELLMREPVYVGSSYYEKDEKEKLKTKIGKLKIEKKI